MSEMISSCVYPVIIVPGIGQSKVYRLDSDGEILDTAWPMDIDADKLFKPLKGALMKAVLFRSDKDLMSKIPGVISEMIEPIKTDPDGSMRYRLEAAHFPAMSECNADRKRYIRKMVPTQGLEEKIGEENIYFFSYNSFDMPYNTAAKLDDYIQEVKREKGVDKVNLLCVSLGGVILSAYLDAYGSKCDVSRVVCLAAALYGTHLASDLLDERIDMSRLHDAIRLFGGEEKLMKAREVLDMLPSELIDHAAHKALATIREELGLGSGSIWASVPNDVYDELADKYLSDSVRSSFRRECDRIRSVKDRLPDLLRSLHSDGMRFYFVVGYGLPLLPVVDSHGLSSDTIVDASSASAGALFKEDGTVDLSNCVFPGSVWLIKGQTHQGLADDKTALGVAVNALSDSDFIDVGSQDLFAQFTEAEEI